ncbi:PREDICTED: MEF2-activating motif and SAP domain-containing transcriptional regulator isoform X3 [Hipposideros armiger]|uniref:MEF2-activating motif and SAP domain-containing transcriptional regulator isoform X3 n=1 Tax=Hipposideros armiger TaxID=186990 RepID=A0A8B7SN42_HIPAR|nr:PREDICTED: MEF2-activating motif and SAP domain-containing transcriptional regulator isoform X3 [Hipposideros armiger]
MTLVASSQRSQIIRSKFRSVLQLRIHRRYQDPNFLGSFATSPVLNPDPWISAAGPALAQAPGLPSGPAPFLFSPGDLNPEPKSCPWRSPKASPKISSHWRESKPKGNLTYHQYMPPEPRQGSRTDLQAKGSALGPPGPPLWEETNSQQPPPRMKPTPLPPSLPGVPSPSPPPHKLELQTLKLEELTTKPGPASHPSPLPRAAETLVTAPAPPQTPAQVLTPSSAPASVAQTLEEELQEAIRRAQLLPSRGIDDILEDQVEPDGESRTPRFEDLLPPIPLDFPGSFDVLSPSPDSEGLSSVFSSSLPSPTNSPSPSPTDSLDWLEALSGGAPLGCGPPAPSIFSADLSDSSGTRLWDLLEDPW